MRTERPASLHSVITNYGDGHIVVLDDENRLAGLLSALLMLVVVTTADVAPDGVYRPARLFMPVR